MLQGIQSNALLSLVYSLWICFVQDAVPEPAQPTHHHTTPRISHRHIEVFRAVMTAGSVTGAAHLLHSSQPTVSRELARLEHLLDYPLFDRQAGRLRPTTRALALWDEVQRAWQGLDRVAERAVALGRAESAHLQVVCLPALSHALLPGALGRLLAQAPQVQVSVTPQESPWLEEWMSAQRFDLGLHERGEPPAGTEGELLLSLDEVAVMPAAHPLAQRPVLYPADFEGQSFVSLAADDPYRRQWDSLLAQAGVRRHLRVDTHSAVAVCAMVQQGLGLGVVNPLTALACVGPGLVLRRLAVSIPFTVHSIWPQYRSLPPEVALLRQALRAEAQHLAAQLG